VLQQDILFRTLERLHHLQDLYCQGCIEPGSTEHAEILALEELESLLVREEKRRYYETKLRFAARLKAPSADLREQTNCVAD
jgi:hypothetical protein